MTTTHPDLHHATVDGQGLLYRQYGAKPGGVHGKFLRALAAQWLRQPISLGAMLAFDAAAVGILERDEEQPLLRSWNQLPMPPG